MPEHGQPITFAEYDAIPETTRFTELIGGVLILSPSVTDDHQRTVGNILYLLHEKAPDGEVYPTLTGVYLDDENVVEPDVIWLAKDGHCKVEEQYLVGAPELLVEILSPATAKRDKTIKFALYERFGVDEYWIVDPKNRILEVWILKAGHYQRFGVYDPEDTFVSPVLGQTIEVKAIFER